MKQDKIQEFYNQKAYQFDNSDNSLVSKDEVAKIKWFLKNTKVNVKEANLFEIAPGSGGCYSILKEYGIKNYSACDTGDYPVEQFNKLFPESRGFLFKEDVISFLEKSDDSKFDCVMAFNIFEHLPDDYLIELMKLLHRKMSANGEIWIHGPCAESILSSYSRYCDLTHRRSFTLKTFKSMGEMFGFEVSAFAGKFTGVENFKDVIRYIQRRIVYWIDRFLFSFEIGIHKNSGVFSPDISVILTKKSRI